MLVLVGFSLGRCVKPSSLGKDSMWAKKRKKIWLVAPLCLFWILWRERNKATFENEICFAPRMKTNFLSVLWSWTTLYSLDNTNSLLEFLALLVCR